MASTIIDRLDGLSSSAAIKGPCKVATTANVSLYGQQTVDGVAIVAGDRVLVKSQTAGYENGIYVADTGQWRRSKDFNKTRDVVKGTLVYVTDGFTQAGTFYEVATADPVIGTMSIVFVISSNSAVVLHFNTKPLAVAASVSSGIHVIQLDGGSAFGDGLGGLYIDVNNGSSDTFTTNGGTRTWYRVFATPIAVSVKDFGAKGDGVSDDSAAFRAALVGGNRLLVVPAGNYVFKSYVRLYANTMIIMAPGATIFNDNQVDSIEYAFINGPFGDANYATVYNGDGNISISGGTFDNSMRRARNKLTCAIAFGHAKNITLNGVTFKNNRSSHFLEVNACRHVRITNCTFSDLSPFDGSGTINYNRECINIDYAFVGGFPPFGVYDNTTCNDVLIEGCEFENPLSITPTVDWVAYGSVAAGTHSIPPASTYHTNIRFIGNRVRNMNECGVTASGWRDSKVKDNYFENLGDSAVRPRACINVEVSGNIAYGISRRVLGAGIFLDGAVGCTIRNNKMSNAGYTEKYRVGIDINGPSDNNYIFTDDIDPGTDVAVEPGLGLWESSATTEGPTNRTVVNGVFYMNLDDNVALGLPMLCPQKQGLILISTATGTAGRVTGLVWARTLGTPIVEPVSIITATGAAFSTGVLTGTTGTAGKLTVSAATDGKIYIENRTGGNKKVYVQFIGGSI